MNVSCEIILAIADTLLKPDDRLAVFSTICRHLGPGQTDNVGCQLHPLDIPSVRSLREELQILAFIYDDPGLLASDACPKSHLDETLRSVFNILAESEGNSATLRESNCQVLIISPITPISAA